MPANEVLSHLPARNFDAVAGEGLQAAGSAPERGGALTKRDGVCTLERVLGGAYQADAVIRLGRQAVNVDWTTLGKLAEHLERPYLQRAFIIFIHPGL